MTLGTDLAPQVLLPGFAGTTVPAWLDDALDAGLAGVCLFAGNVDPGDPHGTARLTAALRARRPDLVVALDEEGGVVTRLEAPRGSTLPSPAQIGLLPVDAARSCCQSRITSSTMIATITANVMAQLRATLRFSFRVSSLFGSRGAWRSLPTP